MKYYSTIFSFIVLNIIGVVSLLYLGNISLDLKKENSKIKNKIIQINEQININEVEYSLYTNYEYLNRLHQIYFDKEKTFSFYNNRLNFEDYMKKNFENVEKVGIK